MSSFSQEYVYYPEIQEMVKSDSTARSFEDCFDFFHLHRDGPNFAGAHALRICTRV